jgi:fermentation-respiration switch protein FrsA (DUF1100 family)
LKYSLYNIKKMEYLKCQIIFIHGSIDELIPSSHSERLFKKFPGKKTKILIPKGSHNDLNAFEEYSHFLKDVLPTFF